MELRRGARELRREVLHQVLHEVALAEEQVLLQVVAVRAQLEPAQHELEHPRVHPVGRPAHERAELRLLPVLQLGGEGGRRLRLGRRRRRLAARHALRRRAAARRRQPRGSRPRGTEAAAAAARRPGLGGGGGSGGRLQVARGAALALVLQLAEEAARARGRRRGERPARVVATEPDKVDGLADQQGLSGERARHEAWQHLLVQSVPARRQKGAAAGWGGVWQGGGGYGGEARAPRAPELRERRRPLLDEELAVVVRQLTLDDPGLQHRVERGTGLAQQLVDVAGDGGVAVHLRRARPPGVSTRAACRVAISGTGWGNGAAPCTSRRCMAMVIAPPLRCAHERTMRVSTMSRCIGSALQTTSCSRVSSDWRCASSTASSWNHSSSSACSAWHSACGTRPTPPEVEPMPIACCLM